MRSLNKYFLKRTFLWIFFLTLLAGCGSGGGGTSGGSSGSSTADISATTIGPNGGSAISTDGKAQITIPAASLSADTVINITTFNDDIAGQVGSLYHVSAEGVTDLVFLEPVTIKVNYDPNQLPVGVSETNLQIGLLGPFDGWEILPDSSIDTVNHIVTATTSHFSSIGVLSKSNAVSAPKLNFPLNDYQKGNTPYTAPISSVFDHTMATRSNGTPALYCPDGRVVSYTNDTGSDLNKGVDCTKDLTKTYNDASSYSYSAPDGSILSYDGHPGYDYAVPKDTNVFAATSGTVVVPHENDCWETDGTAKNSAKIIDAKKNKEITIDCWGTVEVIYQNDNVYKTRYLHLSKKLVMAGKDIKKGEQIGFSGNTAPFYMGAHLHFEVRKSDIPIDPYGWNGYSVTDPYRSIIGADSINLWETPGAIDTTAPSIPIGLNATVASSTQLNLSWTASTDNVGVAGYKIYKNGTYLKSVATTSASDTGLTASTQYCYTVSAFDASGNESAQSSQSCATTQSGTTSTWSGTKQLGTSGDDLAYGVAVDGNGNIYVTGYTCGGLDGNTNAGGCDIFLVKYDSSGAKQWTRQLGTSSNDSAFGVAVDSSGSIYVTGSTSGGLDGNTNAGSLDIFLMKYDSSGAKQWTRQLGTSDYDYATGVAVDGSGNIYVTGYTYGGLDGNTNAGWSDIFLVKYDSSGTKQWTRQLGTSSEDVAFGVAVDGSGNIYVTGVTLGGLDGNTNAGSSDIFLINYDSSGAKQWTRQLGTYGNDYAYGVAVDGNGNIYVTGYAGGGLDGNTSAGGADIFLVKYDSSGTKQWTRQLGTYGDDSAFAVAVDSNGNAYVTGYTYILAASTTGGLDGNANVGWGDIFLVKYDSSGVKQWTRQLGTSSDDYGRGIAVDGSGNAYVTGWTSGGLDGNTNAGSYDIFLLKYDTNGVKQ